MTWHPRYGWWAAALAVAIAVDLITAALIVGSPALYVSFWDHCPAALRLAIVFGPHVIWVVGGVAVHSGLLMRLRLAGLRYCPRCHHDLLDEPREGMVTCPRCGSHASVSYQGVGVGQVGAVWRRAVPDRLPVARPTGLGHKSCPQCSHTIRVPIWHCPGPRRIVQCPACGGLFRWRTPRWPIWVALLYAPAALWLVAVDGRWLATLLPANMVAAMMFGIFVVPVIGLLLPQLSISCWLEGVPGRYCPQCGYDLAKLGKSGELACPECGRSGLVLVGGHSIGDP